MGESGEVRERLVDCATALLMEGGVSAVGIRALARRAGVSHGAPRRYFPTLELLLAEMASRGFEELTDTIAQVDDNLPAPEYLERIMLSYVRFGIERRPLFDLMFRHDLLEDSGARLREHSRPLFGLLLGVLAHADDPEAAAVTLWTNVHGLAVLSGTRALDVVAERVDTERVVRRMVADHLAGITARGTSARSSKSTTKSPSFGP